jgi:hypothetical protein
MLAAVGDGTSLQTTITLFFDEVFGAQSRSPLLGGKFVWVEWLVHGKILQLSEVRHHRVNCEASMFLDGGLG